MWVSALINIVLYFCYNACNVSTKLWVGRHLISVIYMAYFESLPWKSFLTLMSLPTCRVGQVMVHQLSSTSWHRAPQFREFNGLLTLSHWQIYCSLSFPRPTKRCSLYMFMQLKLSWLQMNCCLLLCNCFVFFAKFCYSVRISYFKWVNSYKYLIITVW